MHVLPQVVISLLRPIVLEVPQRGAGTVAGAVAVAIAVAVAVASASASASATAAIAVVVVDDKAGGLA